MKRMLVPLLTSVAMLIAGTAAAEPTSNPFDGKARPVSSEQTMSAEEVAKYTLPYLPRVSRCYKQHALPFKKATGELGLYVVIGRTGRIAFSEITAPGVPLLRKFPLERCLRREMATWQFPVRTGFTNAVIPYYFLQTRPAPQPFPNT
jgi:hypothetical protein